MPPGPHSARSAPTTSAASGRGWTDRRRPTRSGGPPPLLGGLLHIAAMTALPVRLAELGASAGLNQRPDLVRLTWEGSSPGAYGPASSPVVLRNAWQGSLPPVGVPLSIVEQRRLRPRPGRPHDVGRPDPPRVVRGRTTSSGCTASAARWNSLARSPPPWCGRTPRRSSVGSPSNRDDPGRLALPVLAVPSGGDATARAGGAGPPEPRSPLAPRRLLTCRSSPNTR